MSNKDYPTQGRPLYLPEGDEAPPRMIYTVQAPPASSGSSGMSGVLPWALGAAGLYWLFSSGLLSALGSTAKTALEKTEEVVEAVGDLAIGVLDMVKLSIIWPKLLFDQISAPEKELAEYFSKSLNAAFELATKPEYAKSICYIGFNRRLTPIDLDQKTDTYRNDFAHALDLCGMMKEDGTWDRPLYYRAPSSWAGIHVVGVHRTKPWFMVDGHVYCTLPENSYILNLIRLGQDRSKGFNIWKDGSIHHAVEGQLEGILFRLLLWPVEPDTLPPGATDVILYELSVESFVKNSKASYMRARAAPFYGGFPDGSMKMSQADWIIKTYVPIGVDKFGDTEEGRFTPDYLARPSIMNGVYVKADGLVCSTSPLSVPWALGLSPTDQDVRLMPESFVFTSVFATFGMDLRHTSLANNSGWDVNFDTTKLAKTKARHRTFPSQPQQEVLDYLKEFGTLKQWQVAVAAKGKLTVFNNRAHVQGE